jgi:hypothetical protein
MKRKPGIIVDNKQNTIHNSINTASSKVRRITSSSISIPASGDVP